MELLIDTQLLVGFIEDKGCLQEIEIFLEWPLVSWKARTDIFEYNPKRKREVDSTLTSLNWQNFPFDKIYMSTLPICF